MLKFLTEKRKRNKEEQLILNNLNAEFRRNKAILNRQIMLIEKNEKSCLRLIALMNNSNEELRLHNVDNLLFWSVEYQSFNPSVKMLSDVLHSGKVFLIKDAELRNKLFAWIFEKEKNTVSFKTYEDYIEDKVFGYLLKRIPYKNRNKNGATDWKTGLGFNTPHTIFYDREYERLLDKKIYHISILKNEYKLLERIIDDIIERTHIR